MENGNMADQFKDGNSMANYLMSKIRNLSDDELKALWEQFGSRELSEENFNKDMEEYSKQVASIKGIPIEDARILVHGALSRPGSQKGSLVGRSVGIFESEEPEPNFNGAEWGDQLLQQKPEAWGVLYGYNTNGKLRRLKNPIYVNNQQEINKYQNAIGTNGKGKPSAYMVGRYR